MEILNAIKRETTCTEAQTSLTSTETSKKDLNSSKHQSSTVTSTAENDVVSSMENTVSEASSKISSLLNFNISPVKNSCANSLSPKTELSSSSHATRTHSSLTTNSANNCHPNTSPQNFSSKEATQLLDKTVENHSFDDATREDLIVPPDSSGDLPMDTESEKEDVTATLALLNSMASELDEVLDVEGTL